jgi:hypothetical protein
LITPRPGQRKFAWDFRRITVNQHLRWLAGLALLVLALSASKVAAQFVYGAGYNAWTGRYGYGAAAYNPWTGNYGYGAAAFNPWMGGGVRQGAMYNPWTGGYAVGRQWYNPWTGSSGGAGSFYNPWTGQWGTGFYRRGW